MHKEPRKFRAREEQPSLLCFSDTMNRRPLPTPPGNETFSASRLDDDSQLKEFEKLLQTSKNREISGYIEEESMSFTREGLGKISKQRGAQEEVGHGLSKLAGIMLAFGEKIDRVERRLGNVEGKLTQLAGQDQGRNTEEMGKGSGYKAHTISSNMKSKQKGPGKAKNSASLQFANSLKFQGEAQQEEQVRGLERETVELRMKNKALKIDKNILMKMIKDMIDKNPENLKAIDHEMFMKTLED